MRNRRLAVAGVAVVAVALSGCGPADSGSTAGGSTAGGTSAAASTPAAAPAEPAAELAAAATKLSGESLKVKLRMAAGLNAEGVADASGDKLDMTMTLGAAAGKDTKVRMRKIGNDIWMKFDGSLGSSLGASSGKWMHVDATKVPEGSAFSMSNGNPKDASRMIEAATSVQKTGEDSFKGTLDMTKAPGADKKSLDALGAKAKAVPFTARTDSEDRLTELVLDVDALAPGAGKMTTTYYDFGTKVTVEAPPAAQVQEMPKQLLGIVTA